MQVCAGLCPTHMHTWVWWRDNMVFILWRITSEVHSHVNHTSTKTARQHISKLKTHVVVCTYANTYMFLFATDCLAKHMFASDRTMGPRSSAHYNIESQLARQQCTHIGILIIGSTTYFHNDVTRDPSPYPTHHENHHSPHCDNGNRTLLPKLGT